MRNQKSFAKKTSKSFGSSPRFWESKPMPEKTNPKPLHSVKTFGRSNILAKHLFKSMLRISLSKFVCTLASVWLICTTKIVGLGRGKEPGFQ